MHMVGRPPIQPAGGLFLGQVGRIVKGCEAPVSIPFLLPVPTLSQRTAQGLGIEYSE